MKKEEKERWKNLLAVEQAFSYEAHLEEVQRLAGERLTVLVDGDRMTMRGLLAKQMKFLAWRIWLLQGMMLAFLCAVFFSLYGGAAGYRGEHFFARFLCGSGGIIAACALPILQRSLRYGMYELECSTRFSIRGGLTAQLLFIGIGDVGMLSVLAFLALRHGAGMQVVFLFGVIPFMTAAVTGLMLWARMKTSISGSRSIAACAASVFFAYGVMEGAGQLFPGRIMWFGVLYACLCAGMMGQPCRQLFLRERERDIL